MEVRQTDEVGYPASKPMSINPNSEKGRAIARRSEWEREKTSEAHDALLRRWMGDEWRSAAEIAKAHDLDGRAIAWHMRHSKAFESRTEDNGAKSYHVLGEAGGEDALERARRGGMPCSKEEIEGDGAAKPSQDEPHYEAQQCRVCGCTHDDCDGAAKPSQDEPHYEAQQCRVCGCTHDDCSGYGRPVTGSPQPCVEETGLACWWVEYDLCSRCVGADADPLVNVSHLSDVLCCFADAALQTRNAIAEVEKDLAELQQRYQKRLAHINKLRELLARA